MIVVKRQDGASFLRSDIAKAWTALSLGAPPRALAAMAESGPVFVSSMVTISEAPDNDEALAVEGIGAAGLAWGESAS